MARHAACHSPSIMKAPEDAARERSSARAAEPSQLEPAPRVLLIVDMMNPLRFDGAADLARPALRAATAIAALKRRCAAAGVPTVYVNDHVGRWQSDFAAVVAHCHALGGESAQLAQRLAPGPDDLTLLKPRHSAFYGTPLALLLDQMAARELVLTGVATDLCVMFTAMDAYERGFRLAIPADCTAAESASRKRTALAWMERALQARIAAPAAVR
jgi:nicotinamidase-related amidase